MYCIKCGKQIPDDSRFCSFCGQKVVTIVEETPAPVTPPPQPPPIQQPVSNNDAKYQEYADDYTKQVEGKDNILSVYGLLQVKGRRNRLPYFLLNIVFSILLSLINVAFLSTRSMAQLGFVWTIYIFVCYLQGVNAGKRLQDMNINGYIALVLVALNVATGLLGGQDKVDFILFADVIIGLFLALKRGTVGPNFYGPDPLDK